MLQQCQTLECCHARLNLFAVLFFAVHICVSDPHSFIGKCFVLLLCSVANKMLYNHFYFYSEVNLQDNLNLYCWAILSHMWLKSNVSLFPFELIIVLFCTNIYIFFFPIASTSSPSWKPGLFSDHKMQSATCTVILNHCLNLSS